jgi:UDP-N-acetylmuramate--alanine ligase
MGIGGYGMSGLAYLLAKQGEEVTGCDVAFSSRVRRLEEEGVRVFLGHSPAHLEGVDVLVYSTDVPPEEEERQEAAARGIAVRHRSEILSLLVNGKKSVAVTGSHGKSTVTAMAGSLLEQAGLDPVVVVGAEVPAFGGTARAGRGEWVVAEADESDGSFLRYRPLYAVLTNLEPEHLDHYGGDFRALKEAMGRFARECVRPQGFVVACADDPTLREILADQDRPVVWYGFSPQALYRVEEVEAEGGGVSFHLLRGKERLGRVRLEIPGRHNAQNAAGVAALGLTLGLPFELVARALAAYRGAGPG